MSGGCPRRPVWPKRSARSDAQWARVAGKYGESEPERSFPPAGRETCGGDHAGRSAAPATEPCHEATLWAFRFTCAVHLGVRWKRRHEFGGNPPTGTRHFDLQCTMLAMPRRTPGKEQAGQPLPTCTLPPATNMNGFVCTIVRLGSACTDCHMGHQSSNLYMVREEILTAFRANPPRSNSRT